MLRLTLPLAGLLLVAAATNTPSSAPRARAFAETQLTASVSQGFNFQKNGQEIIGHINYLKVGDTEMASDLNVTDPMNIANHTKVFGVASGIQWKGGYAEPIRFAAQVSVDNKNKLATLQHKSMSNTEVEMRFAFYCFDARAKRYYPCFHTNGITVKGLVLKQGGELAMNIAMDQSSEVVSPKNHALQMGVMPQAQAMELHLAFSTSDKLVKPWGVAIAK